MIQVLTVDDLDFPHAAQTARITRYRTSRQASPGKIARLVRSQWGIEIRLHFVRDVTFDEDRAQIRTGHGPENMATLRNLAINKLRENGHTNITASLREMSYQPFTRPLDLLGIAP